MTVILTLLVGFFAGLRSLTPPAATAWAVHAGWLKLGGALDWIGSTPAVVVLTLLALAELIADKLPSTPSRTSPPGLVARIVTGGFCGACVASAGAHGALLGALSGAVGGILGTFGGYQARTRLVRALGTPDVVVAVLEDVVAVAGSLWVVSRF
jgi:uncharacterized membrane protein